MSDSNQDSYRQEKFESNRLRNIPISEKWAFQKNTIYKDYPEISITLNSDKTVMFLTFRPPMYAKIGIWSYPVSLGIDSPTFEAELEAGLIGVVHWQNKWAEMEMKLREKSEQEQLKKQDSKEVFTFQEEKKNGNID